MTKGSKADPLAAAEEAGREAREAGKKAYVYHIHYDPKYWIFFKRPGAKPEEEDRIELKTQEEVAAFERGLNSPDRVPPIEAGTENVRAAGRAAAKGGNAIQVSMQEDGSFLLSRPGTGAQLGNISSGSEVGEFFVGLKQALLAPTGRGSNTFRDLNILRQAEGKR